jgi:hypothetical protein
MWDTSKKEWNGMRKNLCWLFAIMVLMLSVAMATVGTASAAAPVIRVEPRDNTAEVGKTLSVNITVSDITAEESLYGWECRITFNPSIVNALEAVKGPFLGSTGYDTTWLSPSIDNTIGTIDMGGLLTPTAEWNGFPPNGASGSGTLATITFTVVGQGATDLYFKEDMDTELHSVIIAGGSQIESPIVHTAEKGSFSNAGSIIPPQFTIVIAGIVVVVVVVALAVLYFRRKRTRART